MSQAHPATVQANQAMAEDLPWADESDFEDAQRGFIATLPDALIHNARGVEIWNMSAYRFLEDPQPPETANPSLWRQARLNMAHGLFKVCERTYQVRGFDIANMTIIEGDTGLGGHRPRLGGLRILRGGGRRQFAAHIGRHLC